MDTQFCVVGRCPRISGICGLMVATDQLPYRIHGVSGCKSSSKRFINDFQPLPMPIGVGAIPMIHHDTTTPSHDPSYVLGHQRYEAIFKQMAASHGELHHRSGESSLARLRTIGILGDSWGIPGGLGLCCFATGLVNACQDLIQSHRLWRTHKNPAFPSLSLVLRPLPSTSPTSPQHHLFTPALPRHLPLPGPTPPRNAQRPCHPAARPKGSHRTRRWPERPGPSRAPAKTSRPWGCDGRRQRPNVGTACWWVSGLQVEGGPKRKSTSGRLDLRRDSPGDVFVCFLGWWSFGESSSSFQLLQRTKDNRKSSLRSKRAQWTESCKLRNILQTRILSVAACKFFLLPLQPGDRIQLRTGHDWECPNQAPSK